MSNVVIFQNKGIIDLRGITVFGVCAKETDNPIGYFGTGLKYAIAVILREGHNVTIWQGRKKHKLSLKKSKMRSKDFDFCYRNRTRLPFTTELGKNWELWQAFRELYANTKDELDPYITNDPKTKSSKTVTTIKVEGKAFHDLFLHKEDIFLDTEPLYEYKNLEVHEGNGKWLYLNNIRVYKLERNAMFNYNLIGHHSLTEDRTLIHSFLADKAVAKAVAESTNYSFIRTVLEANEKRYESRIDFHWSTITPGETFNKVITEYASSGYNYYNTSAKTLYKEHKEKARVYREFPIKQLSTKLAAKLNKACTFWQLIDIDLSSICVTKDLDDNKLWQIHRKYIYISDKLLYKSDHEINVVLYSAYIELKYKGERALAIVIDKLTYLVEKNNCSLFQKKSLQRVKNSV